MKLTTHPNASLETQPIRDQRLAQVKGGLKAERIQGQNPGQT